MRSLLSGAAGLAGYGCPVSLFNFLWRYIHGRHCWRLLMLQVRFCVRKVEVSWEIDGVRQCKMRNAAERGYYLRSSYWRWSSHTLDRDLFKSWMLKKQAHAWTRSWILENYTMLYSRITFRQSLLVHCIVAPPTLRRFGKVELPLQMIITRSNNHLLNIEVSSYLL